MYAYGKFIIYLNRRWHGNVPLVLSAQPENAQDLVRNSTIVEYMRGDAQREWSDQNAFPGICLHARYVLIFDMY